MLVSNDVREPLIFSVSEFVGSLNQTLEFAYPFVSVVGELANFRISKNRWVYFDLIDEASSLKCFGTVYMLPGPLEEGLMVQISGSPRLHPRFGFSLNFQSIRPVGQGSLKRAASLLESKLRAEGLFADERKRPIPFPPRRIGLVTSGQSAAYADFIKILAERWGGVEITLADVQVQGEPAPAQLVRAVEHFNQLAQPPDVLVIIRGGGSAEDLAAFNVESVTRAVAASRIPTLVAIGHEVDISLAEMAADTRASTPSNAAEMLTPDKKREVAVLNQYDLQFAAAVGNLIQIEQQLLQNNYAKLSDLLHNKVTQASQQLQAKQLLLEALSPQTILKRGYAIVRSAGTTIRSGKQLKPGQSVSIQLHDKRIAAHVDDIQ